MSIRFKKITTEIAENTKFIRIDMIPFFKNYIKKHRTILNRLKKSYKISRTILTKKISKSNVSKFLIIKGKSLIIDWLNSMFNFRKSDLIVEVKPGGTSVDAIIKVKYTYNEKEINFIKNLIDKYNLKEDDITTEDVCLLFLSESVLCIQELFNEIIGYEFSLMMQNDEIIPTDGCIQVLIEIVTRLYV